ncbi:hypothetical protein ACFX11_038977 [Malus domestica]
MIAALPESDSKALLPKLRVKPVPTASGIAVVAGMSKPHWWPHIATTGNICVYCPDGPDSDFEHSTQSYTGYEPTRNSGKVEFILMGGTFMTLPVVTVITLLEICMMHYRDTLLPMLKRLLPTLSMVLLNLTI